MFATSTSEAKIPRFPGISFYSTYSTVTSNFPFRMQRTLQYNMSGRLLAATVWQQTTRDDRAFRSRAFCSNTVAPNGRRSPSGFQEGQTSYCMALAGRRPGGRNTRKEFLLLLLLERQRFPRNYDFDSFDKRPIRVSCTCRRGACVHLARAALSCVSTDWSSDWSSRG